MSDKTEPLSEYWVKVFDDMVAVQQKTEVERDALRAEIERLQAELRTCQETLTACLETT